MKLPKIYTNNLSKNDKKKQFHAIKKSKKMYKKGEYYIRPKMKSFKSKPSKHVQKAKKLYNVTSMKPSLQLFKKTGCHRDGLNKIVQKGKGAYYSSGSRPSQTAESWGLARLASTLTGGKSSGIDIHILKKYCKPNSKPLKLAKTFKQGMKSTNVVTLKYK